MRSLLGMRYTFYACALPSLFLAFSACESHHSPPLAEGQTDLSLPSDQGDELTIPDLATEMKDALLDLEWDKGSIGSDTGPDAELDAELDAQLPESPLSEERRSGIFREGCPRSGFAHARILTGSGELQGTSALADAGDLILMNDRVAFVIQDPTRLSRTWWHYGGQIIDAVPLRDCEVVDIDRLDSLGVLIIEGQLTEVENAAMRAFAGLRAEVISDGTGGQEARVRVYGIDEPMWLLEYELLARGLKRGEPRLLSEPLEVAPWIDYVLQPNSNRIDIEVGVTNLRSESRTLRSGVLTFFGDEADEKEFSPDEFEISGLRLKSKLPWIAAGRMALALDTSNAASAHFAGVDVLIDLNRFLIGDRVSAAEGSGDEPVEQRRDRGDSTSWSLALALDERGLSGAAQAIAERRTVLSQGRGSDPYTLELPIHPSNQESAELRDQIQGAELSAHERPARLEVWIIDPQDPAIDTDDLTQGQIGELNLGIDEIVSRAFTESSSLLELPLTGLALETERYQIRVLVPGLPELRGPLWEISERGEVTPGLSTLSLPARGLIHAQAQDETGQAIPVALRLTPLDETVELEGGYTAHPRRSLVYVTGEVWSPIAPGRYRYTASRGYEYQIERGELEVLSGEVTELEFTLTHLNPTPDFVSFDGHVHAGPSPDSDVPIPLRLRGAAAEGVEVVAGTDHEVITDWSQALTPEEQTLLAPWVRSMIAEESTASLPEHMNIYPLPPRDDHPRGDPPRWYGLGLDRFTDLQIDRGAIVRQLNHPRLGCSYLCIIDYNRLTGEPDIPLDLEYFGFNLGTLWGWNFNAFELLNGATPIFMDPQSPRTTGLFEDWASFINLGHRVTAMGVTDSHHVEGLGMPVTLVQLNPLAGEVNAEGSDPERIGEAIAAGRAQVSLGAWAELDINGALLGDLATATPHPEGGKSVEVNLKVRALPEVDVRWIYLFVNCDLVHTWESPTPYERIKLDIQHTLRVEADAWVTISAFGEDAMPEGLKSYNPRRSPRVLTNAIYIDVNDDGLWTPPGGKTCRVPEGRY